MITASGSSNEKGRTENSAFVHTHSFSVSVEISTRVEASVGDLAVGD